MKLRQKKHSQIPTVNGLYGCNPIAQYVILYDNTHLLILYSEQFSIKSDEKWFVDTKRKYFITLVQKTSITRVDSHASGSVRLYTTIL